VCPEVTFAVVVVLGLVGMVAVQVFGSEHEAEARECNNSIALYKQRKVFSYLARRGG
jgi:hypothetical protein